MAGPVSARYSVLAQGGIFNFTGWHSAAVARQQHTAFTELIRNAKKGKPRIDFAVAAEALKATGLSNPLVVEVGCGSGYYSEVLSLLLHQKVRYIGIDYASNMTALAHACYPDVPFVTAEAGSLPLKAGCCDVLFSGTSLMHIADYAQAIRESVRVCSRWCIFHTIPVLEKRATTLLQKDAYGAPVIEVIFNRAELESLLTAEGLIIKNIYKSIEYDVCAIVGEPTRTLTFLCEKTQ